MTAPASASASATFLVPVDSLPAEGADPDLTAASPTERCAGRSRQHLHPGYRPD